MKTNVISRADADHRQQSRASRSAWSECRYALKALIEKCGHLDETLSRLISFETRRARAKILLQGFRTLSASGYRIRRPENFRPQHMQALMDHWVAKALAPSTLQTRFSVFVVFCIWINKKGMLGGIERYLDDPSVARRTYVAKSDKSWVTHNVDAAAKVAEVFADNSHVGVQLLLMWAFSLRPREAWQFKPLQRDRGDIEGVTQIEVREGAKTGRPRTVNVVLRPENPWQRHALDLAKRLTNSRTGSLIPKSFKRSSWSTYFYRVCRAHGIARKTGVVAYGLRHQGANDLYRELTGADSPVRSEQRAVVEHSLDTMARLAVADLLGHSRKQIAGAYIGSVISGRESSSEPNEVEQSKHQPTGG